MAAAATYEIDAIKVCNMHGEAQALGKAAQLLRDILRIACLGGVKDEGGACRRQARHVPAVEGLDKING